MGGKNLLHESISTPVLTGNNSWHPRVGEWRDVSAGSPKTSALRWIRIVLRQGVGDLKPRRLGTDEHVRLDSDSRIAVDRAHMDEEQIGLRIRRAAGEVGAAIAAED